MLGQCIGRGICRENLTSRNVKSSNYVAFHTPDFIQQTNAHAYIGPGMGVGAFTIFAAFVLGVVLLFIAVVWLPIKRRFFSSNSDKKQADGNQ